MDTQDVLIFGDFTQDECKKIYTEETVSSPFSSPIIFTTNLSNTTDQLIIVFGDFTYEECLAIQCPNKVVNVSKNTNASLAERHINYPLYSHLPMHSVNMFYDIPCARCGYHSHTLDKCIAKRNRYGEFIKSPKKSLIPISPTSSPRYTADGPIYYNQHISLNGWSPHDKTDYTQFFFSEKDVQDWICEDNENNSLTYYRDSLFSTPIYETGDSNMDSILRYNYMVTSNMLYTY